MAWFEDLAFLTGSGVGQPLGVSNSGGTIKVSRGTPTTFKYVDAAKMLTELLPYSYVKAIWVISPTVATQLVQLVDASGKSSWVPNDRDRAEGRSMGSMFGRPIFVLEKLPALGTLGDVMLLDPTLYVIGDRQEVEISASPHPNFLKNQMTWRILSRIDGQPLIQQQITLQDATSKVSPYVILN